MAALAEPMTSAGVMTADEAARLAARPGEPDFLGCGFALSASGGGVPGRPHEPGPIALGRRMDPSSPRHAGVAPSQATPGTSRAR